MDVDSGTPYLQCDWSMESWLLNGQYLHIATRGGVELPGNPSFIRLRILLRGVVSKLFVDCKALGSWRRKLETDKSDVVSFLKVDGEIDQGGVNTLVHGHGLPGGQVLVHLNVCQVGGVVGQFSIIGVANLTLPVESSSLETELVLKSDWSIQLSYRSSVF